MTRLIHMLIAVLLASTWVSVHAEAQQRDCTAKNITLVACAAVSAAATNLAYDAKANCDRDCNNEESAADRADCRAACRRTQNSELAAIAAAAASCVLNAPDCEVVQTINPPPIHPSGVARLNTTRMSASWPAVLGTTGTRSATEPEWDPAQFPRGSTRPPRIYHRAAHIGSTCGNRRVPRAAGQASCTN